MFLTKWKTTIGRKSSFPFYNCFCVLIPCPNKVFFLLFNAMPLSSNKNEQSVKQEQWPLHRETDEYVEDEHLL